MIPTVRLITTGDVDETTVELLQRDLEETGLSVERGDAIALAAEDRDKGRDRYRSALVLHRLPNVPPSEWLLVVTGADLFAGGLNFVYGQADPTLRRAVVSVARLERDAVAGPATPQQLRRRLLTETLHVLGHLRGLEHCSNHECAMHFTFTMYDTDRKLPTYCERCRELLL